MVVGFNQPLCLPGKTFAIVLTDMFGAAAAWGNAGPLKPAFLQKVENWHKNEKFELFCTRGAESNQSDI